MARKLSNVQLIRFVIVALVAALSGGFYLVKAGAQSIGEPGRGSGKNTLNNVYFGEQHLFKQGVRNEVVA